MDFEEAKEKAALSAFGEGGCEIADLERGFHVGADWAKQELTRWRDPKVELPDNLQTTLVKLNNGVVCSSEYKRGKTSRGTWDREVVVQYDDHSQHDDRDDFEVWVVGWRPIE